MAVQNARPSPFNQLSSDADWESFCTAAGIASGVNGNPLDATALTPSLDSSGRNAVMSSGTAIIKGKIWSCDSSVSTPIPAASAQDRIDRLVLRLSRTAGDATSFLQPVVITGTPSGSPVEPALTQSTSGNWDLPICHWTSRSTGALVSLIDERWFTGRTVRVATSSTRPTVTEPTLLFETDTGNLKLWNGSAWTTLVSAPDSWTETGALTSGWSKSGGSGYLKYKKTSDNSVALTAFQLTPGTVADGTTLLAAGGLPSAYQPVHSHRIPVFASTQALSNDPGATSNNNETPAFVILTDGSIQCYGISSVCARVDLSWGEFPLDV